MNNTNKEINETGWESPFAVHPGVFLNDFIEDFSMNQVDLAKRVGLTPKTINEIIKGKTGITKSTALRLSTVFPVSETYWNSLQEEYLSDLARIENEERISEEIQKYLPNYRETYSELKRHSLVSTYRWHKNNFKDILLVLHKYFGASSLLYVEGDLISNTSFRTYTKKDFNRYTIAAWVRAGEKKSLTTDVSKFNLKKLRQELPTIRGLSNKSPAEYLPLLEKILGDCGVTLVYMPLFRNSHVQGAVKWISKDKVALILNSHKRSEDKFWFNLFHELGHIIKHGKKNQIDFNKRAGSQIEEEADKFAQDNLVPNYKRTYSRLSEYRDYRKGIIDLSKELGISPSILAGRIAYEQSLCGNNLYQKYSEFWRTTITYSNL